MQDNMFNQKRKQLFRQECPTVYTGNHSYIHSICWKDFIKEPKKHINIAYEINENMKNL